MAYAYDNTREPSAWDKLFDEEPDWDAPAQEGGLERHARLKAEAAAEPGAGTYIEPCKKCRGTKVFRGYTGRIVGPCRACQGKGTVTYRTSPEQRAKAKQREADRKGAAMVAWSEANPTEWRWIVNKSGSFAFAAAMLEAVTKYGSLTDNQLAAVQRCVAKDAARFEEREAREAAAPTISTEKLERAYEVARSKGVRYPKLPLSWINPADETDTHTFLFKTSVKGPIYVTEGSTYLGKIEAGRFYRVRDCSPELEQIVLAVCADPWAAAKAYGQVEGACCVCSRRLTRKTSIEAGIGPICAGKFGWG